MTVSPTATLQDYAPRRPDYDRSVANGGAGLGVGELLHGDGRPVLHILGDSVTAGCCCKTNSYASSLKTFLAGESSRRRDCHSADIPSPPLLKTST